MIIVYILDRTQWDFWIAGSHYNSQIKVVKKVKDWCISEGADLAFNLCLFNMKNYQTVTYCHNKFGDIGYGGENYSDIIYFNSQNYCRGYSNGINNGIIKITNPLGGARTRNGVGVTKCGKIIIAQSNSNMYEKTFCTSVNNFVQKQGYGVKLFVLEDGGASTSHYSNISKLGFAPEGGRKVPTALCIKRKDIIKIDRTLKYRCKGEDVKLLQACLGGIEVDGSYGRGKVGTEQRVRAAQKALGLKPDGICGPLTLQAMGIGSIVKLNGVTQFV